ncbi:GLIS1_3 [Acanthosepion pharaonis]|uniref:GLIS1_3 n=1 Tax=Acanthosepion pharaonis TaxID=158019 RepID=A0A812DF64_ACAPH|nr:GLIS1_3 [Sepia pharaonis]
MHSRASLFCPVDNTARLFNHHQTSKATTIISIIPTTVGQVIIATKFSLQPEFGLTSDTEAPVSKRAFTFLSLSNTLQVKSGPSFSKRYTCAFLLPVCSLPSSRFLNNRDVGVDLSTITEQRKPKSEVRRSVFCFFFLLLLLPSLFLLMSLLDQYSPKTRVRSGLTWSRLDKTNATFSPLSDGRGNSHGPILVNTAPV